MPHRTNDAIDILVQDHRQVMGFLARLVDVPATDPGRIRELTDLVVIEFVRHLTVEEECLLPAFRKHVPGGCEIAQRQSARRGWAERTMRQLEQADMARASSIRLLGDLVSELHRHVSDQESALFPMLAEHAADEDLIELAEQMLFLKSRAPARPERSGPGLVDRVSRYVSSWGTEDS